MLTDLLSLWLPILLISIGCHIASFVFWAATPWHKPDVNPVPDQDAADQAITGLGLKPGFYMLPCTHDSAQYKEQAFIDRYNRGPWATINVFPAKPNMGRNLLLTLLMFFVVTVLIAYLAASVLAPGAAFAKVFHVAGTAGVLAYTFGGMANGIWFGKQRGWVIRDIIDALVYAAITATLFALLWPNAVTPIP